MTWRIVPDGKQWKVTRHGGTISHHRKKRRALKRARREASSGDLLLIHDRHGRIQKHVTVR